MTFELYVIEAAKRGGGGRNQGFKSNLNYILLLFFLIVNIKNAYHANQRITVCISWILV